MMDEKNCGMLYAEYLKAYAALHGVYAPKPFRGIEDVLKKISSAGIRLGIVTGKSRDSAKITLDKFGLGGYFSEVACGGPTGSVKTQRILGLAKNGNFRRIIFIMSETAPKMCLIPARRARIRCRLHGRKSSTKSIGSLLAGNGFRHC